ncbi:LAFA_0C02740g1_1 [Lachancea sp. 'fantastica']|nr:LAFA_0C02740g1_1 [Lachancea sp. 'fantastica']
MKLNTTNKQQINKQFLAPKRTGFTQFMSRKAEHYGKQSDSQDDDMLSKFVAPGRGILKQNLGEEGEGENLTISDIPMSGDTQDFPSSLNQNNTTSRINTSKLQSKLDRRVSFAPDVTLHRVDFVPQLPQSLREPRRKNTPKKPSTVVPEVSVDSAHSRDPWESVKGTSKIATTESADHAPYTPVFDKEVSMEITQLFSKHSGKPEKLDENNEDAEDMEVTEFRRPQPARLTEKSASEDDVEEDLDLTNPQTTDLQFGVVSDQSQFIDDDLSDMETTEPFKGTVTVSAPNSNRSVANVKDNAATKLPTVDELGSRPIVTSTQEIDNHGIEPEMRKDQSYPSKKRKLEAASDETRFVEKTATEMDDDMELTMMERLSPIQIPSAVESEPHTVDSVETSNLKEKHLSLSAFLDVVGMNAHRDIDSSMIVSKLDFGKLSQNGRAVTVEMYRALYANMPILEIYAFCCKELMRRIKRSKILFEELEQQIATNASSGLFKKYFESQGATREKLNDRIKLLRDYSRLQAVKVWFEWRLGHLRGIKTVLQENLLILREELDVLSMRIVTVSDINKRVLEIKQSIIKEIRVVKERSKFDSNNNDSARFPDRIKIEALKAELQDELKNLEKISDMSKKAEALRSLIENIQHRISDTQREISLLKARVKKSAQYIEHELPKLQAMFQIFQKLSGVSLKQYCGSVLKIELQSSPLTLEFDVTKSHTIDKIAISVADSTTDLCKAIYPTAIKSAQGSAKTSFQLISKLLAKSEKLRYILMEFESLNSLFPCRTVTSLTGQVDIEIRFFDSINNDCATFLLPLDQLVIAMESPKLKRRPKLRLRSSSQNGSDGESLMSHFKSRASFLLPWLEAAELVSSM